MKIETSELKQVVEKLLRHLDELNIEELDLPYDYYWDIPKEILYDSYKEPSRFTIGQLSDNWKDLQALLDPSRDALVQDYEDLAAVLKAVGQTIRG
jgi:hypothetical protein